MNLEGQLQARNNWLEVNVFRPLQPEGISISDVQFDWHDMSGRFILSLAGKPIEDRFIGFLRQAELGILIKYPLQRVRWWRHHQFKRRNMLRNRCVSYFEVGPDHRQANIS